MTVLEQRDFSEAVMRGTECYGLACGQESIEALYRYYRLVHEWNQRMNLVSARDMERFVTYHILDSLKVASVVDVSTWWKVLDFGSGAGLPGIPLALVFPHIKVLLLDSRLKQCRFLETAVSHVPVINATVIRERIESVDSQYDGIFDCVITRATVDCASLASVAGRFIGKGGSLVAIKGENIDEELAEAQQRHSRVFNMFSTAPVSCDGVRCGRIVVMEKQ